MVVGGVKNPRVLSIMDFYLLPNLELLFFLFKPSSFGALEAEIGSRLTPNREAFVCMKNIGEKWDSVKKGGMMNDMAFILFFLHNQVLVVWTSALYSFVHVWTWISFLFFV